MKFFHLSDLHIGLRLFDRDLSEDQEYILREIVNIAGGRKPDAVVIAGDVYNQAVPSAEAVALFDRFISALTEAVPDAEIMVISGNHDSAPRLNVFRNILERRGIHMIGMPPMRPEDHIARVELRDAYGPVSFWLLPFVKPSMIKSIVGQDENGNNLSYNEAVHRLIEREPIDQTERNVLVSHQFYLPKGTKPDQVERMDSEIRMAGNIDEIDADIFSRFDYAALGHIHKPMKVGSDIYRYCGTPMPCSFSEAGQQKGILEVEIGEKGSVDVSVLPLTPLHELRVVRGTLPEVLAQGSDDYAAVVLTDKVDLDVIDAQSRIRKAFPNLITIRREVDFEPEEDLPEYSAEEEASPFDLCRSFLKNRGLETDAEEDALLRDIINTVRGN